MVYLGRTDRYIVFDWILEHGDVSLGETDTVPEEREEKRKWNKLMRIAI